MPNADDVPRAVVVLVVGDREIPLGLIDGHARCDLALIDDLLRLQLAMARRGWSIRLTHVDPDTRELVDFLGLGNCLGL